VATRCLHKGCLSCTANNTTTVCIKVPGKTLSEREQRTEYDARAGPGQREAHLQRQIGPNGVYVARPKNDGGWHQSPTVKAGSMFANPFPVDKNFPVGEGKYSLDESMRLFREYAQARASPTATTAQVIALLPEATQKLARKLGGVRVIKSEDNSDTFAR